MILPTENRYTLHAKGIRAFGPNDYQFILDGDVICELTCNKDFAERMLGLMNGAYLIGYGDGHMSAMFKKELENNNA